MVSGTHTSIHSAQKQGELDFQLKWVDRKYYTHLQFTIIFDRNNTFQLLKYTFKEFKVRKLYTEQVMIAYISKSYQVYFKIPW